MMKKRVMAILLAALMVLALVPGIALADSGLKNSHSHKWKSSIPIIGGTYDDRIIVKTADAAMGQINHSENDSTFNSGDTWNFEAVPTSSAYKFTGWTFSNADYVNNLSSSSNANLSFSYKSNAAIETAIPLGARFTATANFDWAEYYKLNVDTSGTGTGSVSKSPNLSEYYPGQQVTLTANPSADSVFSGWSGAASGSDTSVTVTMDGNKSVTANFTAKPRYTLETSVTPAGSGSVSVSPTQADFYQGQTVSLTANPASGWRFGSWSGSATGSANPLSISMSEDKDITATFIKTYNITLNVDGPGKLNNKNAVAGSRDANSTINLDDAGPNANLFCKFVGWRDDSTGEFLTSYTFTLTEDRSFTAVFGDLEYLFTSSGPNGYLGRNLSGHYGRGHQINLNDAQPTGYTGYTLDCWKEFGFMFSGSGTEVSLTNGQPIITIGDSNYFKAFFKVAEYEITYILGEGGTASGNPSTYTYFDLAFTLNKPTRPGYIFDGWTGTDLPGKTMTVTVPKGSTGDRTYTANWIPINYTVNYNANGGTTGATASSYHEYGVDKALTPNGFAKPGCSFAGWATTPGGNPVYTDGHIVKNLTTDNNGTVELYAKWEVSGVSVTGYSAPYDGGWHGVTVSGDLDGATVSYSTDGITYGDLNPQYKNAMTSAVTVYVKVERDGAAPYLKSAVVDISKATLTVKAANKSTPYGSDRPDLTYNFNGFVKGENKNNAITGAPELSCPYVVGDPAGKYDITITQGTLAAANYAFDLVNGTLSVNKKELLVTADDITVTYNDAAPAYKATITGFVLGEDESVLTGAPKITCAYAKGDPAGAYPINIAKGKLAADNYKFTMVSGTLTVKKATLTVTAEDKTVTYGDNAPVYTAVITGFVAGEDESVLTGDASVVCAYTAGNGAGGYTIEAGIGTLAADNYDFDFVDGTLTVNKAALTVTADDKTVTFLDPAPVYTVSYSGFVAGDDETDLGGMLTFDCAYAPGSAVGPYTITPGGLNSSNYDITFEPGMLTVDELILTVRFVDYNGTELKSEQVVYGNAATPPTDPTREGHAFAGWDRAFNAVTANMTVTARYAINTYTVTFVDFDGTVLGTDTADWNTAATAPSDPAREGHTFTGWDRAFNAVTADMTVTAQYAINTYTVRFFAADGVTQIGPTHSVSWGAAVTAETAPARVGRTFAGWTLTGDDASVETSLSNVRENITAVASYTLNRYTVTFVDFDGTVIGTDRVLYGSGATAPAAPTRQGYTFIGWDTSFDPVTANLTVTALYRINTYTVTFVDYDGTVLGTDSADWNTAATPPADPTREGYTFAGWDADFSTVTADMTVTALYTENVQLDNEPVPGTFDDTTTLEDESVPQQGPSVFPWWWILIGLGAAGLLFLLIFFLVKRRKDSEQAA